MSAVQRRSRVTTGLAVASAFLLLTLAWSEWIETVFRVEPDGRSGALEWWVIAVLAVATLASVLAARSDRQRLAAGPA